MTTPDHWVERRTAGAPAALQACVRQNLGDTAPADSVPVTLAHAAERALRRVLGSEGGRGVALELLAADGLMTLAMLHQAEHDPAGLAELARRLTSQHGVV